MTFVVVLILIVQISFKSCTFQVTNYTNLISCGEIWVLQYEYYIQKTMNMKKRSSRWGQTTPQIGHLG